MIDYLVAETGAVVTPLGIQHKSIAFDGDMTAEVQTAIQTLRDALLRIIGELRG